MPLAIDIGNSQSKFGVFESSSLIDKFSIPTARDYSKNELLFDRLAFVRKRFYAIDSVIICSVVPEVNETFSSALKELLDVTADFVDHDSNVGLKTDYDPISSLGLDRLVNASAAARIYGVPVAVCSFGTATTIDVVDSHRNYLGGVIAPGLRLLAESLHEKTAKLPYVEIQKPDRVFGNSTESSIRSGVFFGHVGTIEGIVGRIFAEMGERPRVVATGGFAPVIVESIDLIDVVDEDLTLKGLQLIYDSKRETKSPRPTQENKPL